MIITKKKYRTQKLKKSLFKQNGGSKKIIKPTTEAQKRPKTFLPSLPSFLKTKSAKNAGDTLKKTFGSMHKANSLLKKYENAHSSVYTTVKNETGKNVVKTKLQIKQEAIAKQKNNWKSENENRVKTTGVLGRVGNGFSFLRRKLSRGIQSTYMAANRGVTGVKEIFDLKKKKSAEQNMAKIIEQLTPEEKEQLSGTDMVNKEKNIRRALARRKLNFEQKEKDAYNARQKETIEKAAHIQTTKEEIIKNEETLKKYILDENLEISKLPTSNSLEKIEKQRRKLILNKKIAENKTKIQKKQKEIQQYNQKRFQQAETFNSLQTKKNKSLFSGESKQLRRQALEKTTQKQISNIEKAALVKKYSTPEYQTKAAETKANFEYFKGKNLIKGLDELKIDQPLSNIKKQITNSKLNSGVKATLIEYYRNLKVQDILKTSPAPEVANPAPHTRPARPPAPARPTLLAPARPPAPARPTLLAPVAPVAVVQQGLAVAPVAPARPPPPVKQAPALLLNLPKQVTDNSI